MRQFWKIDIQEGQPVRVTENGCVRERPPANAVTLFGVRQQEQASLQEVK